MSAIQKPPEPDDLEQTYPSVDFAYDIAVNSYSVAADRLDYIDGRIQTLLAFVVTVTAAIPSVAASRNVTFRSWWFWLAILFVVVNIALGTYARLVGTVMLLHPARLYERWLHFSEWEFKKNMVYFAGKDYEANIRLVERKWQYTIAIIILFSLEAICLVVWVAVNSPRV